MNMHTRTAPRGGASYHQSTTVPTSEAELAALFLDPDYDLNVFAEAAGEYTRGQFSPRSRRGGDWNHDPCSSEYAHTRCREIAMWLEAATECGVAVEKWVVIDDDDLLQTDGSHFATSPNGRGAAVPALLPAAAPKHNVWPAASEGSGSGTFAAGCAAGRAAYEAGVGQSSSAAQQQMHVSTLPISMASLPFPAAEAAAVHTTPAMAGSVPAYSVPVSRAADDDGDMGWEFAF